ncbi:hypothetical protein FB451DRAFT_1167914 [Mycena latifolia]|nr:hypothetical protein FB451DRAFT_1167914 [Mycena latifolia]
MAIADVSERFHLKANEPECLVRPNWNCRGTNSQDACQPPVPSLLSPSQLTPVPKSHSYPMLSCSKLIGFITTALVMGAVHAQVPVPFSFTAYADDNGGGASTKYDNVVTGVCYKTSATARSIDPVPVGLHAVFYGTFDCTHDPDKISFNITYGKPVPLSFIAYADDNGEGAQTKYDNIVTGVCYKTSAAVRSLKAAPVLLSAVSWRSYDFTHVVGDSDGGYTDVAYGQATNTRTNARSIRFMKRPPLSPGDPGDS